jgi:di/tricarboxylate transporter
MITLQIALLLVILVITLFLFSVEWFSADVVALGILLTLILLGLLPVDKAFAGFGSDTVILILGLLILTATLVRTGVVELVGQAIQQRIGKSPNRMLVVIMSASAGLSAFISNTAATAFFIPIVIGLSRRARVSASQMLMPLAFASILASSVTLIGTSTNVVVSGLMTQYGMPPMGMFELSVVGLPIVVIGLAYMFFLGRRLIPVRDVPEELTEEYNLSPFLTEIMILPNSSLIGKTLAESGLGRDLDLTVIRLIRGEDSYLVPQADLRLEAADILLVEGQRDNLLQLKNSARIGVEVSRMVTDMDLQTEDTRLAEVILMPRSPFIGRQLNNLGLRDQYGIQVLAINRHEETIHRQISQVTLRMGDVLLVQGPQTNLASLERNNTFRILGTIDDKTPNIKRAKIAVLIFASSILLAALNLISLPVAVLLGSLFAFLTGTITPQEAYNDVEWKALILIGCMLAFGTAMEYTGTANFLANQIVSLVGNANPIWLLSGFFFLTVLLTQPMSNQAAAVVVFPVAIQTAIQLGLNPRTFSVMIAVAASTSYITPLEPACLLVYGLGRYRFLDFIRVGSLLTILVYLVAVILVPLFWPLVG